MKRKHASGFTLIELLIVIAIIGLLATVAVVSFSSLQKRATDTKRLADIKQIQTALEFYKEEYGVYPPNTDAADGAGGYDVGCLGGPSAGDTFISSLDTAGILKAVCDPKATIKTTAYLYYKYSAGSSGCDVTRGDFYVLAVQSSDSSSSPSPNSPGWSCPSRNWATAAGIGLGGATPYWVTGAFEH